MSNLLQGRLKQIISNSAIAKAYLTSVLGVISGLVTQLVFIRELTIRISPDEFSLYAFVFQVVSYFAILQIGLDYATSREISLSLGRNELSTANYSYWFLRSFNKKIILVVICCILLATLFFWQGWGPSKVNPTMGAILILLFGITQITLFLTVPEVAALIGSNKQYIPNISNLLINLLATVLGYFLLINGSGVYSMPIALILLGPINFLVLRRLVRKVCTWISVKSTKKDRQLEKRTIRYSILATLGGLAWTVEATSDVIILSSAGLINLVGVYVIWWRFPQMLFDLITRFTTSASPGFAITHGHNQEDSFRLFQKILAFAACGALIVFCGISVLLPSFIQIWLNNDNYQYTDANMLAFLMGLVVFVRIIGNCFGTFLVAVGYVKITARVSWIQAIVKIILGFALVKTYSLTGLLSASLAAAFFQFAILGVVLHKKKMLSAKLIVFIIILLLAGGSTFFIQFMEVNTVLFVMKAFFTAAAGFSFWVLIMFLLGYKSLLLSLIKSGN